MVLGNVKSCFWRPGPPVVQPVPDLLSWALCVAGGLAACWTGSGESREGGIIFIALYVPFLRTWNTLSSFAASRGWNRDVQMRCKEKSDHCVGWLRILTMVQRGCVIPIRGVFQDPTRKKPEQPGLYSALTLLGVAGWTKCVPRSLPACVVLWLCAQELIIIPRRWCRSSPASFQCNIYGIYHWLSISLPGLYNCTMLSLQRQQPLELMTRSGPDFEIWFLLGSWIYASRQEAW